MTTRLAPAIKTFAVLALVAGLAAPAAAKTLTAAEAQGRTAVLDDALEFETTVSTQGVYRSGKGVLKNPWNDNHLKAVIDKRTGAVRYEIHQAIQYHGLFRDFRRVNFVGANGALESAELIRRGDNRDACFGPDTLGCFGREDVAFVVDEATLRRIAADSAAGDAWAFKFKADKGEDLRDSIPRAEIAGLLNAVDAHRRSTVATR